MSDDEFYKDPTISRERKARNWICQNLLRINPSVDFREGDLIAPEFLKLIGEESK